MAGACYTWPDDGNQRTAAKTTPMTIIERAIAAPALSVLAQNLNISAPGKMLLSETDCGAAD